MKIKQILDQNRRDLTVIYKCEHCGHEKKGSGYDDTYFHHVIIPGMVCSKCYKSAPDNYRPLTTKYPDLTIV